MTKAKLTEIAVMRAVFFNAHHKGHLNPTIELVKLLVASGIEVHYFVPSCLKKSIENSGAIYHNYGSEEWNLKDAAIRQAYALDCEPSDGMKADFLFEQSLPATIDILPYIIDKLKTIKPDFCVGDSGYPWGFIAAKIMNIPMISSCSSVLIPKSERGKIFETFCQKPFMQKSVQWLRENYKIDYDPLDSYCNYTGFTIVWCAPQYLPCFQDDATVHYFGSSRPLLNCHDAIIDECEVSTNAYNISVASSIATSCLSPNSLRNSPNSIAADLSNISIAGNTSVQTISITNESALRVIVANKVPVLDDTATDKISIALNDDDGLIENIKLMKSKEYIIVYASLGTIIGTEAWTVCPLAFYNSVIQAFSEITIINNHTKTDCNSEYSSESAFQDAINQLNSQFPHIYVVISIGEKFDTQLLPSKVSSNITIKRFVNQTELLPHVDVFITHCGMNSTNEALCAGCPMICIPIFGDQNLNGQRVAELGCGELLASPFAPDPCLNFQHVTADILQNSILKILRNYESYRKNCNTIKCHMMERLIYLHSHAVNDIVTWVKQQQQQIVKDR